MEDERKSFVRAGLPWLVAAGALIVYLLTLNPWVTISSLPHVVRVAGWDWQPSLHAPLYYLVTYPFRWLPESWLPQALNAFTAVCAGLTLALLARSVSLLPHDRTHHQRLREPSEYSLLSIPAAWVPPVLAAFACGLQLTFWENATAATGEILDLLLFAYLIRCLLEHRIDGRQAWMSRFALVYGAAMANNWAMVGYFPAFLAAVVWIRGLSFFTPRFLVQTTLWGLAGLLLYLLLPLWQSFDPDSPVTFWQALRVSVLSQKNVLFFMPYKALWVLGLTSLLPVFVIGIRWASYFGDTSPLGVTLATLTFHIVHGLFLITCLWVAFDPPFSPRHFPQEQQFGFELPFLTLYYLGALSIGYFSGYFLLIFGKDAKGQPRVPSLLRTVNSAVIAGIWLLLVAVPTGLMYRNLPHIRAANGPALSQYADLLKEGLPQSGAVVLSDDPPWRLFLLRAVLNSSQGTNHHVLVRTAGLEHPAYHNFLHRNYPEQWPWHKSAFTNLVADVIESPRLIQLMMELAQSNAVYYLHPSFGYYFEQFYLRPHGLVYEMKQFSDSAINPPPLTSDDIAENQAFWKRIDEETLSAVTRLIKTERRLTLTLGQRLMDSLHLKREPDRHALMLGTFYSRALNHWGVELQKTGRPEQSKEAAWCFARAQELNPDNVVAQVNEQYNQKLRAGHKSAVKRSKSVEDQFGKYRSWEAVIGANGPFDEPALCYEMGRTFAKGALYRQAAQQFERVKTLAPENLAARLWLAQLFNLWRMPDKVLEIAAQIHASDVPPDLDQINQIELAYLEASAQFAKTNFDAAEQVLEGTIKRFPNDENLLTVATQLYLGHGQYSNALATINTHLRLSPDNPSALVNKGFICIQLNSYKDAIEPLSRVLTLQTNNYEALFNRAVAYLRSGNLEAAQRDYEELQKVFPNAYQIYYGLGEIAFRKKDTSSAIRHYELYLTNSPANTEERKLVSARLDDLKKNGSP